MGTKYKVPYLSIFLVSLSPLEIKNSKIAHITYCICTLLFETSFIIRQLSVPIFTILSDQSDAQAQMLIGCVKFNMKYI